VLGSQDFDRRPQPVDRIFYACSWLDGLKLLHGKVCRSANEEVERVRSSKPAEDKQAKDSKQNNFATLFHDSSSLD
jgi:hypothetical protein